MTQNHVILGPRLTLVPWSAEYEPFVREHLNTEEVTRFIGGPKSEADLTDWFEHLREEQDSKGHTQWPVIWLSDNVPVGLCGITIDEEEDSTCLGCRTLAWTFGEKWWRLGLAKQAVLGCLRYAFETLDEHRMVAKTTVDNERSWRLMQRVGMTHDHRLDYTSRFGKLSYVVYTMTWREWAEHMRAGVFADELPPSPAR